MRDEGNESGSFGKRTGLGKHRLLRRCLLRQSHDATSDAETPHPNPLPQGERRGRSKTAAGWLPYNAKFGGHRPPLQEGRPRSFGPTQDRLRVAVHSKGLVDGMKGFVYIGLNEVGL